MQPLFHGTEADFSEFAPRRITWFTPDRDETIDQYRCDDTKPWFIFTAKLSFHTTADLDSPMVRALLEGAGFKADQIGQLTAMSAHVLPILESHGFDGLTAQMGGVRHYAVFSPRQIEILNREVLPASLSR